MIILSNKELFKEIDSQNSNTKTEEILIQNLICNENINFHSFDEFLKPVIIKNCDFKKRWDISAVHFKGPVVIQNCSIEMFCIGACGFHSTFEFIQNNVVELFEVWDSTFYGITKFHKNDFLGGTNIFAKHDSYGAVDFKGGLSFY